jgi:hypothetical protein
MIKIRFTEDFFTGIYLLSLRKLKSEMMVSSHLAELTGIAAMALPPSLLALTAFLRAPFSIGKQKQIIAYQNRRCLIASGSK